MYADGMLNINLQNLAKLNQYYYFHAEFLEVWYTEFISNFCSRGGKCLLHVPNLGGGGGGERGTTNFFPFFFWVGVGVGGLGGILILKGRNS